MAEIRVMGEASRPHAVLCDAQGETPLPALWLRARTNDPSERDPVTGQRLTNPHLLPEDLELTEARLEGGTLHLGFSDGFHGAYKTQDLIDDVVLDVACPSPFPWRADLKPWPVHQWSDLARDGMLFNALRDFITLGFMLVHGTPTQPDSILGIARRFGFVRDTNFGAYFEVYSRPESNDLAYRPVALAPHTDNPYRTPVPGIQLLHCLRNETSGGLSTLVDSLAVAAQTRLEDPGFCPAQPCAGAFWLARCG